jgi:hypothetical protein
MSKCFLMAAIQTAMIFLLFTVCWCTAAETLQVHPKQIRIGTAYDGATLTVRGTLLKGHQAVIEVLGQTENIALMRKVHHWGLWKNGPEIDVAGAPALYMAMSTNAALLEKTDQQAPWGYPAIAQKISFKGGGCVPRNQLLEEFIELKTHRNQYGIFPGKARITSSPDQGLLVEGTIKLPSGLKPGSYHINLYSVQNRQVIRQETQTFSAELVGFPSVISEMAKHHGLAYGCLAVTAAVLAGFLVGLAFQIFRREKKT